MRVLCHTNGSKATLIRADIFSEGIPQAMLETIAPSIVTIGSCMLFGFWFRRACLLILVAKAPRDYAKGVAIANQLAFPEVQEALPSAPGQIFGRSERRSIAISGFSAIC